MNTFMKGILGLSVVAVVGVGSAIGTTTYLMNNQGSLVQKDTVINGFNQPVRLVNYPSVAAENTDFTTAAESAVHEWFTLWPQQMRKNLLQEENL